MTSDPDGGQTRQAALGKAVFACHSRLMFRLTSVFGILCVASLLGGCSSSDKLFDSMQTQVHGFADKLPEWAGGPPTGLPPRPTDPRYAAYRDQIEGKGASVPTAEQAEIGPLH
jgi:hypothetical protein